MVERLFLAVPRGCLRFVIVVFPDHTHLLFLYNLELLLTFLQPYYSTFKISDLFFLSIKLLVWYTYGQ